MKSIYKAAAAVSALALTGSVCFMAAATVATADADGYQVVFNADTIPANTTTGVDATCPSGKVAVGGGYVNGGDLTDLKLIGTFPYYGGPDDKWGARFENPLGSGRGVTVYAVCINE